MAPVEHLAGSIMSKSATGGAGRGDFSGDVVGGVIFHGKKQYWRPGSDFFYHHLLKAGDNTLEALLARRAMAVASVTSGGGAGGGAFDAAAFTTEYVDFMTTPDSHADTYCGTAHRIFFGNLAAGKPPAQCPGNDGHNVDTADALVTPVVAAWVAGSDAQAGEDAAAMVRATRDSPVAAALASTWAGALRGLARGDTTLLATVEALAGGMRFDVRRAVAQGRERGKGKGEGTENGDELTACYLDSSLPAMLKMAYKYGDPATDADGGARFERALLANANRGGENCATGALLGALLGADCGFEALPAHLVQGLAPSQKPSEVEVEVEAFLDAILISA